MQNKKVCLGLMILGVSTSCLLGDSIDAAGSPRLPFTFVRNMGQANNRIRYIGNGPNFKGSYTDTGVVFQQGDSRLELLFDLGNPHPMVDALEPTGAVANYFIGQDHERWLTDLPLYSEVRYRGVWPGIEIRFNGDHSGTKAEYVVAPGASIDAIRLRFEGDAELQPDGSLTVTGSSGQFHEEKPFFYQEYPSGRHEVQGRFLRREDGTIGFIAEDFDRVRPLVVDPTILFSGYVGGVSQSSITAVAVNSNYSVIAAGWTNSTDLQASGGAGSANAGGVDAFVAGFSPAGGNLIFCTYLGGSGDDRAFGLTLDSSNNIFLTGWTSSGNFPVHSPIQTKLKGARDAFVAKLSATANALIYSTYLGGSGVDSGNGISIDSTGSAIVVGDTTSIDLPATPGTVQTRSSGAQDVFVAKMAPSGTVLSFLTYFGGSGNEHGTSVKVDSTDAIVIGGSTWSLNFPILNAFQPTSGGGQDAFVSKISSSGTQILFSSYLGGSGGTAGAPEQVNALALGLAGNVVAVGVTSSVNFPTFPNSAQPVYGGGVTDGFICQLDPFAGALRRSTFVGGSSDDGINGVVLDLSGAPIVTGYTVSTDFPVVSPVQRSNAGAMDAFVLKTGYTQTLFGTYLGGSGNDSGNAIAIDSGMSIVIAGSTGSGDFDVKGLIGGWKGNTLASFITKIAPNFMLDAVSPPTFLFDLWHNTGYSGTTVTLNASSFGAAGDIPIAGDWDGSGWKRIGVFRQGMWILDMNGNGVVDGADKTVVFGLAGDLPVLGDWNGTGRVKLGLFRQGTFILDLSGHLSGVQTGLSDPTFAFGSPGDIPISADWNQSGFKKVGVFRAGQWLVDFNGDRIFNSLDKTYTFGQSGDIPVVGDWASVGIDRIGVYRNGIWILDYLGSNTLLATRDLILAFGGSGYVPVVQ